MKKRIKLLSLILAGAAVCAPICGCGGNETKSEKKPESVEESSQYRLPESASELVGIWKAETDPENEWTYESETRPKSELIRLNADGTTYTPDYFEQYYQEANGEFKVVDNNIQINASIADRGTLYTFDLSGGKLTLKDQDGKTRVFVKGTEDDVKKVLDRNVIKNAWLINSGCKALYEDIVLSNINSDTAADIDGVPMPEPEASPYARKKAARSLTIHNVLNYNELLIFEEDLGQFVADKRLCTIYARSDPDKPASANIEITPETTIGDLGYK